MKTVMLPSYMEPIINRLATDKVEVLLGLNPSDKRYNDALNQEKKNTCNEFYELSTGIQVNNPTSEKAKKMLEEFNPILFLEEGGFLKKNYTDKNGQLVGQNLKAAELMSNRLRGAIINLAHIWLEATYEGDPLTKMPMKRTDRYFSQMAYKEKTSDKAIDQTLRKAVEIRRLKRDVIVGAICAAIHSAFKLKSSDLEAELLQATANIPPNMLGAEKTHEAVAERLGVPLDESFGGVNINSTVERNLKRPLRFAGEQEELL